MDRTELVEAAARRLVAAMASPDWPELRERFLVALSGAPQPVTPAELERSRAEVVSRPDLAAEAVGEWKPRLRRMLEGSPDLAVGLARLTAAPSADAPAANTVTHGISGAAVQAGTVHGDVDVTADHGHRADQRDARARRDVAGRDTGGVQFNIAADGGRVFGAQHGDVLFHRRPQPAGEDTPDDGNTPAEGSAE